MTILTPDIERVLLSAFLGAVLGLERQWRDKEAGLRTLMLVSVGATLFTIVSYRMPFMEGSPGGDVTRIASNIVTGIGFLGAGLIFRSKIRVHGLTTAAAVWTSAAIGMAAGIGNFLLAVETTLISLVILVFLHWFEDWFKKMKETRSYTISYASVAGADLLRYDEFFSGSVFHLIETKQERNHDHIVVRWTVRAPKSKHDEIIVRMLKDDRILSLTY